MMRRASLWLQHREAWLLPFRVTRQRKALHARDSFRHCIPWKSCRDLEGSSTSLHFGSSTVAVQSDCIVEFPWQHDLRVDVVPCGYAG